MKKKITTIDVELAVTESSGIAYYRLPKDFKEFLTLCNKKHQIVGVEFEDGSYNFGVILKEKYEK
jgi:hypothetical protein